MDKKERDWFFELILQIPELPGIIMLVIGLALLYCSKKGDEWMYESGGPGIFSNITWIKNTFGEEVAKRYNVSIAWIIIGVAIFFILIGIGLHIVLLTGEK